MRVTIFCSFNLLIGGVTYKMSKLSKLRVNKITLVLFGFSWGMMAMPTASYAITPTPAASQAKAVRANDRESNTASLAASGVVSTKAIDLLSPVELPAYFTDIQTRTYKLGQLDFEQFCRDFPYNSKCQGNNSNSERETDSIPVPVPPPAPPAPPEGSQESNNNNSGEKSGWAIVPEISTLGIGGHVVKKIVPQVNARVGINAFSLGLDGIDTDIDYDADLNLFNVSTLIDIHPSKRSGFRLSGGFIIGNNNFDGSADVSELVTEGLAEDNDLDEDIIDGLERIDGLANVDADVEVANGVSPYIGIGGGNAVGDGKGFGFWWNMGVVFSGSPDVDLDTSLASDQIRSEFAGTEFEGEVDRIVNETEDSLEEVIDGEEDDIQDEIDFLNIYPVISVGISYQF